MKPIFNKITGMHSTFATIRLNHLYFLVMLPPRGDL